VASREERRRRREIERRLRELDRLDRERGLGAFPAARPRRRVDRTGLVALLITVASLVALLFVQPGLVPVSLRNAVGLGPHRVADAVDAGTTGSFAFLAHQAGDANEPVAWDPCRRIRYVVNPDGGPPGAIALVQQAIARVEQVSGLGFEYAGETGERPQWDSPVIPIIAARNPVLVSWADSTEVPQLAGDVAGIGGSVATNARDGRRRYVTGGVTLDANAFAQIDGQPDGAAEERAIVLHELGHLLGLAHVSDQSELMNAENLGLLDYGPGDLAGLAELGHGPCF
jgi:hypothetical protein